MLVAEQCLNPQVPYERFIPRFSYLPKLELVLLHLSAGHFHFNKNGKYKQHIVQCWGISPINSEMNEEYVAELNWE